MQLLLIFSGYKGAGHRPMISVGRLAMIGVSVHLGSLAQPVMSSDCSRLLVILRGDQAGCVVSSCSADAVQCNWSQNHRNG